jgi:flavin-dependent dehydrogenase
VLTTAIVRVVTLAGYYGLRRRGALSPAGDALGTLFLLTLPLIAFGFAAGLASARLAAATALERLTRRARRRRRDRGRPRRARRRPR